MAIALVWHGLCNTLLEHLDCMKNSEASKYNKAKSYLILSECVQKILKYYQVQKTKYSNFPYNETLLLLTCIIGSGP